MANDESRLYIMLYADADVDGRLAGQIRMNGYDAVSAYEAGNGELEDWEQFDYAISRGRALLTHNARHFEPLLKEYFSYGKEHSGLIISEKLPLGELLRRVLRMLNSVSADEMKNSFRNLGEFK